MYATRNYNLGDHVMWLVKGSPENRGGIRWIPGLGSEHWRGNRLRDEPLIMIEGVVNAVQNTGDRGGRQTIDVAYTASTIPEELYDYLSSHNFRFEPDYYQQALNTVIQRMIPAWRDAGRGVTSEVYEFMRELMYPVVVVDGAYHSLLSDLRGAVGHNEPSKIASREALIAKAASFGIPFRETLIPGMYNLRNPQGAALERAQARWEEYNFDNIRRLIGLPAGDPGQPVVFQNHPVPDEAPNF